MPQNDPVTMEAVVSYLGAALASVTGWAWKHTHSLVKEKANASEVILLAASVKDKADSIRVDKLVDGITHLVDNQREDNNRIFDAITNVVETHTAFSQKMTEEMGRRPTREECSVIWHRPEQK